MPKRENIVYSDQLRPDVDLIVELYRLAHLMRPIEDKERIRTMFANSPLVVTAWDGTQLIGILRGWTDGAYDGYICDLAIHPDYQKLGIGKEILQFIVKREPKIQWVLRASKIAANYYAHLGWHRIDNGWFWPRAVWQAGNN